MSKIVTAVGGWALLTLLSSQAFAGAFDEISVQGHCSDRNTHVVENGNSLSILFDEMGAFMPQGEEGEGKLIQKVCQFKVRITFPRDMYLAGLRQTFSGGVIKSKGSQGALNLAYTFAEKNGQPEIQWKQGEEITAESAQSLFTYSSEETLPQPQGCSGKVKYGMRIGMRAHRKNQQEFFIGGLDSYDADLVQKLVVTPIFKLCRRNR